MIIHYGYENLKLIAPVVTLGVFDGVHRGHKTLLDILVSRAKEAKGESVVITFSPHPRLVLETDNHNLSFLTTLEEKKALIEKAGVDHLVILEFNNEFSKIEACDFVKKILAEKVGTKHLVIGHNHHFGLRGEGDFNTIMKCSGLLDFKVEQVPGYTSEEATVSSSRIRATLLKGNVEEANSLLGYSYSLTGSVVTGRQIGRSLGFPTANISPDDKNKLIPGDGVYAVEINIDKILYKGMLSIGSNPTVNDDRNVKTIEVHILDFEEDIYGKRVTVIFRKWLREEKKFDSIRQLTDQMMLDREDTISYLT